MTLAAWNVSEVDNRVIPIPRIDDVLEKRLEAWIASEPSLVDPGIAWVAEQLVFPGGGRLDLLGLTPDDKWVVAELKSGGLYEAALMQALGYAVSLGSMDSGSLATRLSSNPFFTASATSDAKARAEALLAAEGDDPASRAVALMLVGTSRDGTPSRGLDFLARHGLDIAVTVVTFDLFASPSGDTVLVRDVDDTMAAVSFDNGSRSVESVQLRARERGCEGPFESVLRIAAELDLPVKPWVRAVTVTAPRRGNPTLLYVRPEPNGILNIWLPTSNVSRHLGIPPERLAVVGTGGDFTPAQVDDFMGRFKAAVTEARAAES